MDKDIDELQIMAVGVIDEMYKLAAKTKDELREQQVDLLVRTFQILLND